MEGFSERAWIQSEKRASEKDGNEDLFKPSLHVGLEPMMLLRTMYRGPTEIWVTYWILISSPSLITSVLAVLAREAITIIPCV